MVYLTLNQAQMITFVLVDGNCDEVPGLGAVFNVFVSEAGGAFGAGAGAQAEIGNGWYRYTLTAAETDTVGPLSIYVTGVGVEQQNLVYFVKSACVGCTDRTFTVTDGGGIPIQGVDIEISTDLAGTFIIWCGDTDVLGVARDVNGELPCLLPGTYYFWLVLAGYTFVNPTTEVYV